MQAIRIQAGRLRAELSHGVDDDAAAFEAVLGAMKIPKSNEAEQQARQAAIQVATLERGVCSVACSCQCG